MVTWAIHLEAVSDMSTNAFLNCLRRFIASRGTPRHVVSDNAMTFRLASEVTEKVWKDATKSDEVQTYCANNGIK